MIFFLICAKDAGEVNVEAEWVEVGSLVCLVDDPLGRVGGGGRGVVESKSENLDRSG